MRSLAHWALASVLLCQLPAHAQASRAEELSNSVAPHFGLLIGDRLTQHVRIAVPATHTLVRDALPKIGRANRWLELRGIDTAETREGAARVYDVRLHYQVMTSDETISLAALPRPALRFAHGEDTLTVYLAEQQISVSPISDIAAWERPGLEELRPEHGTPLMNTSATRQRIAAYLTALAALGAYWLYRIYGLPFVARSRGPFARAARTLRGISAQDAPALQSALRQLHRAFDATYGKPVFGHEVAAFLQQHPRYAPLREAIQRFFEQSQRQFYAHAASDEAGAARVNEVRELARRLSLVERGLA